MTTVADKKLQSAATSAGAWGPVKSRVSINGALGVSLIALLLCVVFILMGLSTLVSTAFSSGTGKVRAADELDKLVARHKTASQNWQDRFNGRSVFFKPQKPYTPPPPVRVDNTPKPPPPPPPPPGPDPTYRGPAIAFAVGDAVYFNSTSGNDKYLRVRTGEEKSGVHVISCDLPWSVKVGYNKGEYDVPIFNRDNMTALIATNPKPPSIMSPFVIDVKPTDNPAAAQPTATVPGTIAAHPGEGVTTPAVQHPLPQRNRPESKPLPATRSPDVQPTETNPDEEAVTEQAGEDEPIDEGDPAPPEVEPEPPHDPDLSPHPTPHPEAS